MDKFCLLRGFIFYQLKGILIVYPHIAVHQSRCRRFCPSEMHLILQENKLFIFPDTGHRVGFYIVIGFNVSGLGFQLLL